MLLYTLAGRFDFLPSLYFCPIPETSAEERSKEVRKSEDLYQAEPIRTWYLLL